MLFRYSLDAPEAADLIERAVDQVLAEGYRTADIVGSGDPAAVREVGTRAMADQVLRLVETLETRS